MADAMMREIPMPPDNRPTAEQASIDAARGDDGLRVLIVSAIWSRDEMPTAAAQHGGYVYEIADRVAQAVERREQALRAERDALKAAIERVRADCEAMVRHTSSASDPNSWRMGVYGQAKRTLSILAAALDTPSAPESPEEGNER